MVQRCSSNGFVGFGGFGQIRVGRTVSLTRHETVVWALYWAQNMIGYLQLGAQYDWPSVRGYWSQIIFIGYLQKKHVVVGT